MTSFITSYTSIRCDECGLACDINGSSAAEVRKKARVRGWTAGRAPRNNMKPKIFDACPQHMVPDNYTRI